MRSHRLRRWRLVLGSLTLTGLTLMTAGILLYALQPRFQRTGPDRLAVFSIIVGVLSLLPLFATIVRWSLRSARKRPALSRTAREGAG